MSDRKSTDLLPFQILLGVWGLSAVIMAVMMWSPMPNSGADAQTYYRGTITNSSPSLGLHGPTHTIRTSDGTLNVQQGGVSRVPYRAGDRVVVVRTSDGTHIIIGHFRLLPVAISALLLLGAVIAVAGWSRGLRSLVGLAVTGMAVLGFAFPALASGHNPYAVAYAAGTLSTLISVPITHGISRRTMTALLGIGIALMFASVVGSVLIGTANFQLDTSSYSEHAHIYLHDATASAIIVFGFIIATLGAIDDVAISQASTTFEIADVDPSLTRPQVYSHAMNVGKEHAASMVNTLFLAYAGASAFLIITVMGHGDAWWSVTNTVSVSSEIMKTVLGSFGLILAVPITTALASWQSQHRRP